jgi:hypothetical protein
MNSIVISDILSPPIQDYCQVRQQVEAGVTSQKRRSEIK